MTRALFDVPDVVNDVFVLALVSDLSESHLESAGATAHRVVMSDAANALAKRPPALGTADIDLQASH
ncbi:MAG: hypothetical protein AB7O50_05830 [Pseudolabrys sp.]